MCVPYLQTYWIEMKKCLLAFRANGDRIGYIRTLLRRVRRHLRGRESGEEEVSFNDVGGCEEAKQQLMGFVHVLKNLEQGISSGAEVLREGVILNGRPGTGKTLLANATAGEANVPLISVCGPKFEGKFVGCGPARIWDVFSRARKKAPCILFIDEIDVIGRKRSSDGFGVCSEEQLILTQLLRELDATNPIDIVDESLLRPGRFDKEIFVPTPDVDGREAIFRLHLQRLKTDVDDMQLPWRMASFTFGFTGANVQRRGQLTKQG